MRGPEGKGIINTHTTTPTHNTTYYTHTLWAALLKTISAGGEFVDVVQALSINYRNCGHVHLKSPGGGREIVPERREHVSIHVLCVHTAIPVTPAGEEQIKNGKASFPDHSHLMVKHIEVTSCMKLYVMTT